MKRKPKPPTTPERKRNACPACGNKTTVITFSAYGACAACGSAWYYDKHNRRHQAELGAILDEAIYEFDGWTNDLRKAFGIEAPGIFPNPCQRCGQMLPTDGVHCAQCAKLLDFVPEIGKTFLTTDDEFHVGACSICGTERIINQDNLCEACREPVVISNIDEAKKRLSTEAEISDIDQAESEDDYRYG